VTVRVSIILPTYNGEAHLRELLPRIAAQEVAGGFEIRAIDSSSHDRSRELLEAAGAHVTKIPKAEFRHGGTRTRCAREAEGEFLVFLSQDVEPLGTDFLEQLVSAFEDPRVAGTYARVLPREDDEPLTRRTVLELPEASERGEVRDLDSVGGVWELSPEQRAQYLRFNDVASAIRASVWREIPFPDMAFGEDFAWAARALTAGWRICFNPRAVVHHAHRYTPRSVYERYKTDAAFHRRIHGYRMRPNVLSTARGFFYELRQDARFCRREGKPGWWRALARAPGLRAAQVLGQYVGSRAPGGSPPGLAG
jgi:rhamnosyltransferase